ncbi:ATP-binding protein [Pseudomonas sp. B21-053]|uniref:ATP-binding protein n=1 Tax=Pseudomonas sp. B21-053 TaxID=2895493 RepID=UPI00223020EF|nr:ATP-binding protein [Pseudomonas sp. B21-053]UZE14739.1 ATP-binding protein [Pseudomonas sp. B21-053]
MSTEQADTLEEVFTVKLPPRPYPGLRPFEKHEWPIFFGRERMADAIVNELVSKQLLVVHGDSGCGKSSLIRAAVLPRLEQESARAGLRWRTCTAMPRGAPLLNIAEALASVDGRADDDDRVIELRRTLNFGAQAPKELARLMCKHAGDHVCILIDQFEELFEHARKNGPEEAQLLTQFLIALQQHPPPGLYVVLTMRSEFLGSCAHYKGFAEAVNVTQYLLPRMNHSDLLRAICEPAKLFDGEISLPLAERLIVDAGGGQDQLPLIQHGLMLLFEQHVANTEQPGQIDTTWRLGLEQYKHTSGLAGLLSAHADEILGQAQASLPDGSQLVEAIFRALTDINADGKAIRRPLTVDELIKVTSANEQKVWLVLDLFRVDGVSFLKPHGHVPLERGTLIDISHEALIRCWQKIDDPQHGWLIREFRAGLVWRALLVQVDSFEQDADNVLGAAVATDRERWILQYNEEWAKRYGGGWGRVQALLKASIKARDHTRRMKLIFRMGVIVVTLAGLSAWAVWLSVQRTKVGEERELVSVSQKQAISVIREAQNTIELVSTQQTPSDELSAKLTKFNSELNLQARQLETISLAPRIYLHIADESQRSGAEQLGFLLEANHVYEFDLIVPRITLSETPLRRSVLRCFRVKECAVNGRTLVKVINETLKTPSVTLEDLSNTYENSPGNRPEHYELWFAPGLIEPRPQ